MNEQIKLTLFRNPARRAVEFYLMAKSHDGKLYIAQPIVMQYEENPVTEIQPAFTMSFEDAQIFIDELWQSGFRPRGMGDSEINAQAKHLEDMRKIAFMFLESGRVKVENV